jgi:tRNA pseudouridine55 synthase
MNGIINIYKPSGESSFQTVNRVKKILGANKCGHTGTLDPIAEGVLPVCVNQATKLSDYIMAFEKEYIAEIVLGKKTDTMDITGKVLKENSNCYLEKNQLENILDSFIGNICLKIPSYSSVKIGGKRSYQLARKGMIEDAGSRHTYIKNIELLNYEFPTFIVKVKCSKGTYIRSLVDAIGEQSGCYAVMSGLVRSKNGHFDMRDSLTPDDLKNKVAEGDFSFFIPVNNVLNWPVAVIKNEVIERVFNGMDPEKQDYLRLPLEDGEYFFISTPDGKIAAFSKKIYEGKKPLKLVKVFKNFL